MKRVKSTRIWVYALTIIGLSAVIFMWLCTTEAVLWAGWRGFGDIPLQYTAEGERAAYLIMFMPAIILVSLLLIRLIVNMLRRENRSRYAKDLFVIVAAVCIGILAFFVLRSFRQMIVDTLQNGIVQAGWMEYPIP